MIFYNVCLKIFWTPRLLLQCNGCNNSWLRNYGPDNHQQIHEYFIASHAFHILSFYIDKLWLGTISSLKPTTRRIIHRKRRRHVDFVCWNFWDLRKFLFCGRLFSLFYQRKPYIITIIVFILRKFWYIVLQKFQLRTNRVHGRRRIKTFSMKLCKNVAQKGFWPSSVPVGQFSASLIENWD